MKQILNRFVALLISMSNFAKPSGQKRVNDRSEKNDGRNSIERFPLNSRRELSEQGRNLMVMVAVYRQRKLYSRPRRTCSCGQKSTQAERGSDKKKY
jgi:hypothetical protein